MNIEEFLSIIRSYLSFTFWYFQCLLSWGVVHVIVRLIKAMQPVQFSFYFAVVAICSHRLPIFFNTIQVVCHVIDKQGSVCLLFHIEDYLQSLLQSASIVPKIKLLRVVVTKNHTCGVITCNTGVLFVELHVDNYSSRRTYIFVHSPESSLCWQWDKATF